MRKKHHFYVGLLCLWFAWWLIWRTDTPGWHIALWSAFGLWMVIDDLYQHERQRRQPGYRSPVNRIYRRIFGRLHVAVAEWIERKLGLR